MATLRSDEVLLTPLDASRVLGVGADTVRFYANKGMLPVMKTMGGRRLFRRSDVDKLAAERSKQKKGKG